LNWLWSRFGDLGVDNLYDALALRCRVFILEQGAYQDPDGLDRVSWHLLGRDSAGVLQAYLRVVDPGHKFDEPSIGRVITSPEARGSGLGRVLMAEGVDRCLAAWPGHGIRISAQSHLARFYGTLGFERVGEDYLEDGIPHCEMVRGTS
jgi:ElaA protein